ncbi:MAG TPA: hypothetical protein VI855_08485, partial [Dehalococcoidia bacterium]|nr:hypothetical protein [Dehalococcoidia bacterium]
MPVNAWGQIYIGSSTPQEDPVQVGSLWTDTVNNLLKRCTSVSPYTWVSTEGGSSAHTLDSATHTGVAAMTEAKGMLIAHDGANWVGLAVGVNGQQLEADSAAAAGVKWAAAGGGASNEFNDDVFRVRDQTDTTKKIALEASGITTATIRTITMPDRDVNLGSAAPADVTKAAAAEGTATSVARSDHKHDITAAAAGASAVADTAAEGTATSLARSDHRHSREAFGGAGYPLDVEAAEADGAAATLARSDHQHKLGIMTTRGDLIRRGAAAAERLALGANGQHLASDGTDAVWEDDEVVINFIIDGGGSAITTGQKGHVEIPFPMTITGWTILADQSGSIVVDVWKDTYANFPPTVADTIAGTEKPTLASVQKNQDLALGTWTTALAAG